MENESPSKKKMKKPASTDGKTGSAAGSSALRLIEKRKHPRFLLTHEQFRESKNGKVYTVYDLSVMGLAIKVDHKDWKVGSIIQGILNLHPDSIEISPRVLGYYGDRVALKIEALSTYSKGALERALSPRRLGASLQLIREKLPLADYWFHGVCNTDLLVRLDAAGKVQKADLFFANFYCGWSHAAQAPRTGICQSFGIESREPTFLADEPVKMESIEIDHDVEPDPTKLDWATRIVEASLIDKKIKGLLMDRIKGAFSGS